jgi:hypothetical protein
MSADKGSLKARTTVIEVYKCFTGGKSLYVIWHIGCPC